MPAAAVSSLVRPPGPAERVAVGIDGYPRGWVAIALGSGAFRGAAASHSLLALVKEFPSAMAIGVDIPLGLLPDRVRQCDRAAYQLLGPRRNSVFMTPPEPVVMAATFQDALQLSRRLTGIGLSRQAFALAARILEADAVRSEDDRIFEVHPEVSFWAMNNRHLAHPKTSWSGFCARLELLRSQGIEIPAEPGQAGLVPPVDVLDAAAAAWSANRRALGKARSVAPPEEGPDGHQISIWY